MTLSRKSKISQWFKREDWRSGRDSNPRYAFGVYSLSRRAPSTTRPPLRMSWRPAPLVGAALLGKGGRDPADRRGQINVFGRDAALAVGGKADLDPVPAVRPV